MRNIDLNSDMGEGFGAYKMGDDAAMLDIVTSANVACGFHAGDPSIMFDVSTKALARGVNIGAHPGFQDLYGFGRRIIKGDSLSDIEKAIVYQIAAFDGISHVAGHKMSYVKVHGALNNMAQEDDDLAFALARAVKSYNPQLIFMVMPHLALERAAQTLNMPYVCEIFADRTYESNGNLTSRKIAGSVLHDEAEATARVLEMLETQTIITRDGGRLSAKIDTVCVHSDEPSAVKMAAALRVRLLENGWSLKGFA